MRILIENIPTRSWRRAMQQAQADYKFRRREALAESGGDPTAPEPRKYEAIIRALDGVVESARMLTAEEDATTDLDDSIRRLDTEIRAWGIQPDEDSTKAAMISARKTLALFRTVLGGGDIDAFVLNPQVLDGKIVHDGTLSQLIEEARK